MRNNSISPRGGAKKFLYSGPKKTTEDEEEELPWSFNKNTSISPRGTGQVNGNKVGLDVDEVWNIRRNVNIGAPNKSDSLTFNVNKNYYSRYGNKEKEEIGNLSANPNTTTDTNQGISWLTNTYQLKHVKGPVNRFTGTGGRSWNMAGGDSRRPFSYSFGVNQPNTTEKPVSPRNMSNSSFANYPPVGNVNNFGSMSSRESVSSVSKETQGNLGNSFGTMSSREPKTQHFTNSKIGQSLNSFPSSGNTNSNFGQSKSGQTQSYSNSVFNGSLFSKNNMPW